jgi:NADPH:quinone reductase-like Zn-dependent oxidoreductase
VQGASGRDQHGRSDAPAPDADRIDAAARSNEFKALLASEIMELVWPLVADGALRPVMDRVFPLADAAAAHARMESGGHIGKIVLAVGAAADIG